MVSSLGQLQVLARKLQVGPPSIGTLIDVLKNSEAMQDFVRLVRDHLPEHEVEIMGLDREDRGRRFVDLFERRYFPLQDHLYDYEEAFYELLNAIPIPVMGMSWDDMHDIESWGPGHQLLLALARHPYEDEGGVRVIIMEQGAKLVGEQSMKLVPKGGWSRDDLHRRLDGTEFEPVALFADWLWQDTGVFVLDVDYENYYNDLEWSTENVAWLTEQWPRATRIMDRIRDFTVWLEDDPRGRFRQVVSVLAMEEKEPRAKTLVEVFSEEA